MQPNSMVLTLVGAGLLWFGWFGFNGGSSLGSNSLAASAFAATQAAAAAAGLSWIFVEWLVKGKPTALGLASGIVAGLVAVTPASGFVYVWGGLIIGLIAGVVCYFAVSLKSTFGYDDSLDAFGVHGVGGFLGAILTGFLCYYSINSFGADGPFAVGGEKTKSAAIEKQIEEKKATITDTMPSDEKQAIESEIAQLEEDKVTFAGAMRQPLIQLKAAVIAGIFAFVASLALVALVQMLTLNNFNTDRQGETTGLDLTEHGEVGFDVGPTIDIFPSGALVEPKAAKVPPTGKRFAVVIEGTHNGELMDAWSKMCQPGAKNEPEFTSVYGWFTTVNGNRFQFAGGQPDTIGSALENLFKKTLRNDNIKARIET
jgi:ammonia channel protein AmtB